MSPRILAVLRWTLTAALAAAAATGTLSQANARPATPAVHLGAAAATSACTTRTTLAKPAPGGRAVHVSTSAQLTTALAKARPGDVITMANGTYTTKGVRAPLAIGGKHYYGTFVISRSGTAKRPIVLQGTSKAVIDGKPGGVGTGTQYGLYLAGADHWHVQRIWVRNVSKGIVLDRASHDTLSGLTVSRTGQEGIHLRSFSSRDIVRGDKVRYTGRKNATYGEGIYVGSASSNWSTYTGGKADRSDGDRLRCNIVTHTGAESVDIKEGTVGGLVQDNTFDGTGMSGDFADSWIDVKGNRWRIDGNHGTHSSKDGFQVHQARSGWGNHNTFTHNVAVVDGPGYGFWLQKETTGNTVACNNTVKGAKSGFATVRCTS